MDPNIQEQKHMGKPVELFEWFKREINLLRLNALFKEEKTLKYRTLVLLGIFSIVGNQCPLHTVLHLGCVGATDPERFQVCKL